jgi:hypothetical protein
MPKKPQRSDVRPMRHNQKELAQSLGAALSTVSFVLGTALGFI